MKKILTIFVRMNSMWNILNDRLFVPSCSAPAKKRCLVNSSLVNFLYVCFPAELSGNMEAQTDFFNRLLNWTTKTSPDPLHYWQFKKLICGNAKFKNILQPIMSKWLQLPETMRDKITEIDHNDVCFKHFSGNEKEQLTKIAELIAPLADKTNDSETAHDELSIQSDHAFYKLPELAKNLSKVVFKERLKQGERNICTLLDLRKRTDCESAIVECGSIHLQEGGILFILCSMAQLYKIAKYLKGLKIRNHCGLIAPRGTCLSDIFILH